MDIANVTELSPAALAICATYWKKDKNGAPARTCCKGCPLQSPCGTWTPTTPEGIDRYARKMNAAALKVVR